MLMLLRLPLGNTVVKGVSLDPQFSSRRKYCCCSAVVISTMITSSLFVLFRMSLRC